MTHTMDKFILSFLLLALSSYIYADEKLTIRNSDTGESFEISMPENIKIYEYNSNWLDSIPYLIEHAKWMEPWSYEALGDCYRYGKGGVDKSMTYALSYYKLSGRKMGEFLKQTRREDPDDELGLFAHVVINFLDGPVVDIAGLKNELSTIKTHDFRWLDLIHKVSEMNKEKFTLSDIESLIDDNITPDECIILTGIVANQKLIDTPEEHPVVMTLLEKFSFVSPLLAEHYFESYDETSENLEPLSKALEKYRIVDNNGFLTKEDMGNILYIKDIHGINFYDYFTSEDLKRFEELTK